MATVIKLLPLSRVQKVASFALAATAFVCAFSLCVPVSHADISSDLVGYWALNETSGTAAADSSSSGNTGTVSVTADWVSGKFNNAFSFDGSSYIDVSRPVQDDFTMCAWFKTSDVGGGNAHFDLMQILDSEVTADSTGDFGFGIDAGGRLAYGSGEAGFDFDLLQSAGAVNDNDWHQGCVTRQESDGTAKLYLDGALADTDTLTTTVLNGNPTLRIGGFQDFGANGKNFIGLIDDVRIFSRTLSGAEITALYQLDPTISTQSPAPAQAVSAGLPWCSGPMAPGWNVGLPHGGCSLASAVQATIALLPSIVVSSSTTVQSENSESSGREALILQLQQQLAALIKELTALMQARNS